MLRYNAACVFRHKRCVVSSWRRFFLRGPFSVILVFLASFGFKRCTASCTASMLLRLLASF
uniref:Uncharacterized protein n=1 Tax=Arundo donax TaxID=35708 RepID=A0A0A8YPE8_ARUDO